jgi:hypothetical protein
VVRHVLAGLDNNKREIVEWIGFRSMFQLPDISDKHINFDNWMLSEFEAGTNTIVLDENVRLSVSTETVRDIIGIPAGPKHVRDARCMEENKVLNVVSRYSRREEGSGCVLADAQRVLESGRSNMCSMPSVDAIRVAAVIFFMGHMLAPHSSHSYVYQDFWGALVRTDEIRNINWALYVLEQTAAATVIVQQKVHTKQLLDQLRGYTLLLQVLFLPAQLSDYCCAIAVSF